MNVKNAQNRTPGSVTFRSRCTSDGTSSRNDANAVGEAGGRRRVARNRRLVRPELKLPARPAVVLRLQQEVARVPEVLAELDGVVARRSS